MSYIVKSQYGPIQEFEEQQVAIEFSARMALNHPETKFFVTDHQGTTVYEAAISKEQLDPEYAKNAVPFSEIYRTTGKILSGVTKYADALKPFALRGLPDSPHPDEIQ